jgi:hypothetical protein
MGVQPHVCHAPYLPVSFEGGVHDASPTPMDGGLATQVLAPPAKKVQWDRQPR